jgi:hypothetical protein
VSIGVGTILPDEIISSGEGFRLLLKRADKEMYKKKHPTVDKLDETSEETRTRVQ